MHGNMNGLFIKGSWLCDTLQVQMGPTYLAAAPGTVYSTPAVDVGYLLTVTWMHLCLH